MSLPEPGELRELLSVEPPLGVLSVYVRVDHADRGGGWRLALSDALREALAKSENADDHELKVAARATAERVLSRFPANGQPPDGRGHVGLVEVSAEPATERWWSSSATPRGSAVAVVGPRPHLQPLVEMIDDHRRRGVVAVTGERARLLEWEEATLRELGAREILTTGDWRERKAPRNADIPRGQSPTSSGRDLHEQRLDHHRQQFVDEIAREVEATAGERGWGEILCFGESKYLSAFEKQLGSERIAHAEEKNLIPIPEHELAERLEALGEGLNRSRELALIDRAEQAALAGGRGSLGLLETAQALAEGRVDHLLIAGSELPAEPDDALVEVLAREGASSALPVGELLIERALETGSAITPVEGEGADRLAERDGAAALLRY
jgi:hypothetical protein